jgi:hypothetical protein
MTDIEYMLDIETLKRTAEVFGSRLCHECVKQYKPAALVMLQYTMDSLAHISPMRFRIAKSLVWYRATRCCKITGQSQQNSIVESIPCFAREPFGNLEFIKYLLLRYPKLKNKPITLRTLQEAGCNLEAEIAMWQLAKEGDGEQ